MKFKIKDEDLVTRDLEEAVRRLPIKMRLAGIKPEERLEGLKTEKLKRLKEILDNLN